MSEFINSVQHWERAAMAHESAPSQHLVLVDPDDPGLVLIVTQFADRATSEEFAASGLMESFMNGVVHCSIGTATRRHYDLFYAAGDGPRAIFGEAPKDAP